MKVAVVAEYYPRAADPVLGVWAHRQALAARDAGAEVRVLVLHRPVPSRAALRARDPRALVAPLRQPLRTELDGLRGPTTSPSSPRRARAPTARWGAWAAPTLALALRGCGAVPLRPRPRPLRGAGRRRRPPRAARRAGRRLRPRRRRARGRGALRGRRRGRPGGPGARAARARQLGGHRRALPRARRGATCASSTSARTCRRTGGAAAGPLVTVGHLVARKRHADVLRALWLLRDSHPDAPLGRRRRRAGARARWSGSRPSSGSTGACASTARSRRPRRAPSPGGRAVRAAERRRGVRRRLRGGDGGRRARDRLPRRAGPGGDRRAGPGPAARAAGRSRGARRRDRRAGRRARLAAGAGRGGAGHRRGGVHLGAVRPRDRAAYEDALR